MLSKWEARRNRTWVIIFLINIVGKEPAFILIPNRLQASSEVTSNAAFATATVGPCTCLEAITEPQIIKHRNKHDDVLIASGHLNGWIVLWSFNRRRSTRQWLAHPHAQVSTLSSCPMDGRTLISQGRDGFVRFWYIESLDPPRNGDVYSPPNQHRAEIRTCESTFCQMSVWPAFVLSGDDNQSPRFYYLAHISPSEDDTGGSVKGTDAEVIQLPDNVVVANTSMDTKGSTISGFGNLGMCMALKGIPEMMGPNASRCLLITAYESGDVFVLSRGQILTRLNNALGEAVPVMSLAVLSRPDTADSGLIALGGPSQETSTQPARTLAFFNLLWDADRSSAKLIPLRDKLPTRSCGVGSLFWRSDSRILAVGQWDGDIRLVETRYSEKWRIHQLGWLPSLGAIDSGELLGDWAATTVKEPHGPIIDQQSTTVRALLFTPESHWLISSAPASAGAVGSLLVWNVYRTENV